MVKMGLVCEWRRHLPKEGTLVDLRGRLDKFLVIYGTRWKIPFFFSYLISFSFSMVIARLEV